MKLIRDDDTDVSIDMSPMIDMVFLLLIFFIVASAVVDFDKPKVSLPSATKAKTPEDVIGRLTITIDAAEQVYVGPIPVTLDALKERLGEELELDPNIRLFIRADEAVPYRVSKKLMIACAEAGALDLIYASFEE